MKVDLRLKARHIRQPQPDERGVVVERSAQQHELTVLEFEDVGKGTLLNKPIDLFGGELAGADELIDAERAEDLVIFGDRVFLVVYAGHDAAAAELLGDDGGHHVRLFRGRDGKHEVGRADARIVERLQAGGVAAHGEHVEVATDVVEHLLVLVDENDVLVFGGHEFG